MAKKPQTQKEQFDTEDELLNFDLEELFGNEALAEDEVIELVELIEVDKDEDRTRELAVKSQVKEKPAAKAAKAVPIDEAKASVSETAARRRANVLLRTAFGRLRNARQMPARFGLSGESPNSASTRAPAQVHAKCAHKRGHSWMFFQENSRKFFLRTDWM